MSQDYSFEGWVAHDKSSVEGNMKWGPFTPKTWEETDVDIKVTHVGVCGSDVHTLRSGWGEANYPLIVGHEIIGRAVRVGSKVKHVKVGDRVGVGAQGDSCQSRAGSCGECEAETEHLCRSRIDTYNSKHWNGEKTYGGYANYHRAAGHFVLQIPDGLDSAVAAPLLCGGITAFSPLKNNGVGPGKNVGIVGLGGIGHFGVLFAKALEADKVVAISRKAAKREEALQLGADKYIATDDDKDWAGENERTLDVIVSTVSSPNMPLKDYLRLLRPNGRLIQIGAPEGDLPAISAFDLLVRQISIGGSLIGSPKDISYMLQLAADKKLKPWIQERPMKDANQTVIDMEQGKARYRYTLVQD